MLKTTNLHKKLEFYRDKLLLINPRNRSILLRRIYDKWSFDLFDNRNAHKIIFNGLTNKKPVNIVSNIGKSKDADRNDSKLRNLYRNMFQIERETGRSELYLGFPFIEGYLDNDFYLRGPLVLIPIILKNKKSGKDYGWNIEFSKDKRPTLNRAILELIKKRRFTFLDLESLIEKFDQLTFELESKIPVSSEISLINSYIGKLIQLFYEIKLPFEPNYNFHIEKIESLLPISVINQKENNNVNDERYSYRFQDESTVEQKPIHLANYVIIGNFPQGESSIFIDYEELIKKIERGQKDEEFGLVHKLLIDEKSDINITKPKFSINANDSVSDELDTIVPNEMNLVIDSDASQDKIIVSSQNSECTVVRGPPGTGKSQIIVNLISNTLSKNQKILVICQKKFALDVIFQRLNKVGLTDCVALLDDPRLGRSELYKRLSTMIESTKDDNTNMNLVNTRLNHYSDSITQIIQRQKAVVDALKDEGLVGISINKLYSMAKPNYKIKIPELASICHKIQFHMLTQLLNTMQNLEANCKIYDDSNHPLFHRQNFSGLGINERDSILNTLEDIIKIANSRQDMVFLNDYENQTRLVESLEILQEKNPGFFKKYLPNTEWKSANDYVEKCISRLCLTCDINNKNEIKDLYLMANVGKTVWESVNKLFPYFDNIQMNNIINSLSDGKQKQENQDHIINKIEVIKSGIENDFFSVQAYDRKKEQLDEIERKILQLCLNKLNKIQGWKDILKEEIYIQWINYIENHYDCLKGQPFENYIHNRDQLVNLISSHQKTVAGKIVGNIHHSVIGPDTSMKNIPEENIQINLWSRLRDELNKKSYVLPLRKLLLSYKSPIFKIAPCWLSTPEAVSTSFPLEKNLFDVIIFDEASQTAVEKAIPAIYRGKKLLVIGDEKQLHPFDLFRIKDDETDMEEMEDRDLLSESLLLLCNRKFFNFNYLEWHYRSLYQELIDFSNYAFYDGRLNVAPNLQRKIQPIKWIQCNNGVWQNRCNKPEAELVVQELANIFLEHKNKNTSDSLPSIGIITFNSSQQELILDTIDKRRSTDIEFDKLYVEADLIQDGKLDNRPFVKNIENVQGDERDIIIFSIGYAPENPDDLITVNFGSINRAKGENRLNVAITRARHKIIIVCSFDPNKIKIENMEKSGPVLLKKYLCYAKSLGDSDYDTAKEILSSISIKPAQKNPIDYEQNSLVLDTDNFDLVSAVSNELSKRGYNVDKKIGFSRYRLDIAVVHPDDPSKYILGIECDDHAFLSTPSTKERDVTRQQFLEKKGWIIERVWSKNWWLDSGKEINRIQQKIEELRGNKSFNNFHYDNEKKIVDDAYQYQEPVQLHGNYSDKVIDELESVIKNGERENIEFKSSLIWDYKLNKQNKEALTVSVLKTIAAFMNTEGGQLFIGIGPNGESLGLENDFKSLGRKNDWDEWNLFFYNIFNSEIGAEFGHYIKVKEIQYEGKPVAFIKVRKNDVHPVYLNKKNGDFYIRSGTQSIKLNPKETFSYVSQHWKH